MHVTTEYWRPLHLSSRKPITYLKGFLVVRGDTPYIVDESALGSFLQELAKAGKKNNTRQRINVAVYSIELRAVDYGTLGNVYRRIFGKELRTDR